MVQIRKVNKQEKKDYPDSVAVIIIGRHEAVLLQKDIDKLFNELSEMIENEVLHDITLTAKDSYADIFKLNGKVLEDFVTDFAHLVNGGYMDNFKCREKAQIYIESKKKSLNYE